MLNGRKLRGEPWKAGRIRIRHILLPDRFRDVLDHATYWGWHECDDRYCICREQIAEFLQDYLLILTLDGEGLATVNGERHRLTRGMVMIFPKGVGHTYCVPPGKKWEFYWMHLDGPNCSALLEYMMREYGCSFEVDGREELAECFELLLTTEYRYYEFEFFAARMISKLLFGIMDGVHRARKERQHGKTLALQVIDYIEAHLSEPLSIRELGARLYLSAEHIIRVFREETGMTPYQYAKQLRLRRACSFLEESDRTVAEIAAAVGYQSVSAFIAQFRGYYGITPGMYRRFCAEGISGN